jgi:NAD-dependent oxidoreductase involved in siderophore biosynthesis
MAIDAKGQAFAQKVGRIVANRYPDVVDEHMEGWLEAPDPEAFRDRAMIAMTQHLWREIYEAMGVAIDCRQKGEE